MFLARITVRIMRCNPQKRQFSQKRGCYLEYAASAKVLYVSKKERRALT
jgi:hypothetical protein